MAVIPALDQYTREDIAPDTLALLCDFAACDLNRPLRTGHEIDWQAVIDGLARNALLPVANYYLQHQQAGSVVPDAFTAAVQMAARLAVLRTAVLEHYALTLLDELNKVGIPCLIVKGPAVAHSWYPDPGLRIFNDLDVIVRERDWGRMHRFLTERGFVQEEAMPEPPPKGYPDQVMYETKYYHADQGFKVEVHYDDIFNAGLVAHDIDAIWQRAETLTIKQVDIRVLSPADQVVHLCAHAHYHGYVRLNWFTDLAVLVRDHDDAIHWRDVVQIARAEGMGAAVYYSLYYLDRLLGVSAPTAVITYLRPAGLVRRLHELYQPEARVMSMRPMQRPDFSFYLMPLYKRLLPDLLVMGRRVDKLRNLAHALVPSYAWLAYYYNLRPGPYLTAHRIIHPVKLALHYLRETFQVILNRTYSE